MLNDIKNIHLVGIGGCSMSGLAQIFRARGYNVRGSDRDNSPFTKRLMEMGIPVTIGHDEKNIEGADLIIYSAAIKPDNIERKAVREKGIPEMERSVALGELSSQYKQVVGIAGGHGKTTITSMLARITMMGKSGATVHVGGDVDFLSGGILLGDSDTFITEACEYVESFLTLRPTMVSISNIDDDHLDYFKDIEEINMAFYKFLELLPTGGLFVGCCDDERVNALLLNPPHPLKTISYGKTAGDYTPGNIQFSKEGFPSFDVINNGKNLGRIKLIVPGDHNIINALCAIILALALGEDFAAIQEALSTYTLTHRRFEYFGSKNGYNVYHDYAHHPNEIRAALNAATRVKHNKIYCVFQCNSYTRAKTLFLDKDPACFTDADVVLVPDIYPGRDIDDGSIHARDMVNAINRAFPDKAVYLGTFENIKDYLDKHAKKDDLVLTVGSGDVFKQTQKLL